MVPTVATHTARNSLDSGGGASGSVGSGATTVGIGGGSGGGGGAGSGTRTQPERRRAARASRWTCPEIGACDNGVILILKGDGYADVCQRGRVEVQVEDLVSQQRQDVRSCPRVPPTRALTATRSMNSQGEMISW